MIGRHLNLVKAQNVTEQCTHTKIISSFLALWYRILKLNLNELVSLTFSTGFFLFFFFCSAPFTLLVADVLVAWLPESLALSPRFLREQSPAQAATHTTTITSNPRKAVINRTQD